jgi:hypothetical protein
MGIWGTFNIQTIAGEEHSDNKEQDKGLAEESNYHRRTDGETMIS